MIHDCAIIGGGPAGLNAALVLGRARRNVVLIDNGKPRNAVTQESHGFITRDGISPGEFRKIAHQEISKYPSVHIQQETITHVEREASTSTFLLTTDRGATIQARKIILATGLKEILPNVDGIKGYYGKSLFSCPYCDGWELRDKPLIVISENQHAFHMAKIVYNWSRDVVICTNGQEVLTPEQKEVLGQKNIKVYGQKITALAGKEGYLEKVIFEDGIEVERKGGFIRAGWLHASSLGEALGCKTNDSGGIVADDLGRTTISGVYAAGDSSIIAPSQVIIAAASGSRAAIGVNTDLTNEDF